MRSFLAACLFGLLLLLTAYTGMFGHEPSIPTDETKRTTIVVQREFQEANLISNVLAFENAVRKFEHSPGVLVRDLYIEKQHPDYRNALRCYANLIRTREIELAKKYTERVGDKPEVVCNGNLACSPNS